jgi:hypothetical protein
MHRLFFSLAFAVLAAALPGSAYAAAAGAAEGVNPAASATRGAAIETLVVGSDIFIGDRVETGPRGQVQIRFADQTELVVGPASTLTIEDYLIRNNGDAGKLAVDMLAGTFRFASGKSAKDRYAITTPTGTIGVRGTGFDVFVATDGTTRILLHHGSVRFCSQAKQCAVIADRCAVGEYDRREVRLFGDSRTITGEARAQLKGEFPYAENQSPLLRQFWMPTLDCLRTPPQIPAPVKDPNIGKGPSGQHVRDDRGDPTPNGGHGQCGLSCLPP